LNQSSQDFRLAKIDDNPNRAINRPAESSSPLKQADISWLQPALAYSPEIYFGAADDNPGNPLIP